MVVEHEGIYLLNNSISMHIFLDAKARNKHTGRESVMVILIQQTRKTQKLWADRCV